MPCQPGDRIVLVATADPRTLLIPGTIGTVTARDDRDGRLDIAWDNGSTGAMLPGGSDQVRPLASPGPEPESLRSADGRRVIEVYPRHDGTYHMVVRSAVTGRVLATRAPGNAQRMITLARRWSASPARPDLAALAEAVRCHVPVQPRDGRHGSEPVPVEMFWGPLGSAGGRPGWSVRFVTGLKPGRAHPALGMGKRP